MKKLMIAVAIVCAAAVSQAASATWQISNVYKSDDASTRAASGSYTGYFFLDSGDTSMAAITAILEGSGTAAEKIASLSGKALQSSALTGSGRISTTVDFGSLADGSYQGYTVVIDGTPAAAENYIIGPDVKVTVTSIGDSSIGSWNAGTVSQAGYSALSSGPTPPAPIPEPTSGLLVVLGLAGLALRRRRA